MAKSRKVSSISKEFDGKEVQGKLIERSGLFGSKVSKEVFKMPGGGKHIEKTRTNKKGDVVSRLSRDTKVNPLKLFNDNKEKAYKKAGGEMSKYKKSLKRFQGNVTGSQVASAASNAANSINPVNNTNNINLNNTNTPRPSLSDLELSSLIDYRNINNTAPVMAKPAGFVKKVEQEYGVDPRANLKSVIKNPTTTKGIVAGQEMEFTPKQMESIFGIHKRGGSVKRKRK